MLVQRLDGSLGMTPSPRDSESIGQRRDLCQSNVMLCLMKTTYEIMMALYRFPGHCLRRRRKQIRSSNTPKTQLKISKRPKTTKMTTLKRSQKLSSSQKQTPNLFRHKLHPKSQIMSRLNPKNNLNVLQGIKETTET